MLKVWGRPYSSNVIPVIWAVNELGLKYEKAHSVNECVLVDDLYMLTEIYENILNYFFKETCDLSL